MSALRGRVRDRYRERFQTRRNSCPSAYQFFSAVCLENASQVQDEHLRMVRRSPSMHRAHSDAHLEVFPLHDAALSCEHQRERGTAGGGRSAQAFTVGAGSRGAQSRSLFITHETTEPVGSTRSVRRKPCGECSTHRRSMNKPPRHVWILGILRRELCSDSLASLPLQGALCKQMPQTLST